LHFFFGVWMADGGTGVGGITALSGRQLDRASIAAAAVLPLPPRVSLSEAPCGATLRCRKRESQVVHGRAVGLR
jgi:hypothetical protein